MSRAIKYIAATITLSFTIILVAWILMKSFSQQWAIVAGVLGFLILVMIFAADPIKDAKDED
jgi:predicted benzoate:H+ symporter BenE